MLVRFMTADELKAAVNTLGLTQRALAKILDVRASTVTTWATGAVAVPGPVRAYIRLALEVSKYDDLGALDLVAAGRKREHDRPDALSSDLKG